MKELDTNYPTIGITSTGKILEDENGYWWEITTHVEGPDDLATISSEVFMTKKHVTLDLLTHYADTVKEQLQELGK